MAIRDNLKQKATSGGGSSSGGGGTSGGSSIENGYTVNFHDAAGNLVESHSALYGYWIDQPISHLVDHWEDANEVLHEFPLVVTADMGIEVVNVYECAASTCERILYNYFGVDRTKYPYCMINILTNADYGYPRVIFSTNSGGCYLEDKRIYFRGGDHLIAYANSTISKSNLSDEVAQFISNCGQLQSDTTYMLGCYRNGYASVSKTYGNFEHSDFSERLDETLYQPTT